MKNRYTGTLFRHRKWPSIAGTAFQRTKMSSSVLKCYLCSRITRKDCDSPVFVVTDSLPNVILCFCSPVQLTRYSSFMLIFDLFTPNDDVRPVFLTGSFNDWTTRDERFKMVKIKDGHYQYTFHEVLPKGEPFEYKYVKGGWEAEELGKDGHPPTNRRMEAPRGKVADIVPQWKQHTVGYDPTYYPDIQIVAKRFNVPQLRRKRRIAVLLPWNYQQTDRRYPVLYLQDGQNLFEHNAPFGTWGVDKKLAFMAQHGKGDFIVVAIDHGGKERIREFSPYDTHKWGEGMGRAYAEFMVETLKPHIDKHFRTLPDRAHTGVGGSSMGGLISIYAGLM
ncbi:MAG: hypothetical protein IT262_22280, partial [Saprospiraceae bacterium]|nr:hypothetical protein [Saprospiraceae bacterium]